MSKKQYYYDISLDIKDFPKSWVMVIIGGRNTGKTYSALRHMIVSKSKFVFLKRTIEDVDLICTTASCNKYQMDLSPFKAINRDFYTDIRAKSIKKGIGAFYNFEDDEPTGNPVGYILALNAVTKFKGFDLSECDYIIFDEFIPQPWDRVNRKEGEQLLDLYKTVSRDREHRGKDMLKLLCLANATSISNPVCNILEITDDIAIMNNSKQEELYIEDRGIYIRMLQANELFKKTEEESLIYKAMGDTAWGRMAFENEFAYNDFTSVGHISLKGFKPYVSFKYKNKNYYVYLKMGLYYFTTSRYNNNQLNHFDLNIENHQKKFWNDYGYDLRVQCIDGNCLFESYTLYDIVINYKSLFKL